MALFPRNSPFSRVTALAGLRPVHAAFSWLHGNPKRIMDWQVEVVSIPAPPFGEQARSAWMAAWFEAAGLERVEIDEIGNVLGYLPAGNLSADSTGAVVILSAHLDTVFPAETVIQPAVDGDRMVAPGSCDNGAGLAGLMAIAQAMVHAKVELPASLLFLCNVGEEGEGDLRGVRHLYGQGALSGRVAAHIVLDGAGADSAVTQALGSRRYQVVIQGPGGHSFTDAGTPNPIAAMSSALAVLADSPMPTEPRTTLNLGTIHGGTSVNSIPERVQASVDCRSTSADQLLRMEVALHRAVEDAVERTNLVGKNSGAKGGLTFTIEKIGDRPAAHLAGDSPILETLRAVDRHLGLRTDLRLGSTDANVPLALGIPALSMGAGGSGGGAHTLAEWYSDKDREIGLKRVLLLTLAMTGWAAEQ